MRCETLISSLFLLGSAALGLGCGGASAPATSAAPTSTAQAEAPKEAAKPAAKPAQPGPSRTDITVADLRAAIDADNIGKLVDVRTPPEYGRGHVPGAVNIPLKELLGRLDDVGDPGQGTVHVICQSGGRSSTAADVLVGKGYTVVNVQGGTGAWIAAGNPTE